MLLFSAQAAQSVSKKIFPALAKSVLSLGLVMGSAQAFGQTAKAQEQNAVANYAGFVYQSYANVLTAAEKMQVLINEFVANPNADTMKAAKDQWTEARKLYSRTEVFRFYAGPIDAEDGPEGAINAWPLDEAYIDGVLGNDKSGIINNVSAYPSITGDLLRELNEKDGEKNISTGWHAIEFLLWGQDFSEKGPGQRPFSDYIVGKGKNAERRAQYLTIVTELLIEDLATLQTAWDPANAANYQASFVSSSKAKESLGFMLTGAVRLAGFELSQERMYVAYDTQLQEDEHSCFSDTTHNDILYNFLGIKDVVMGSGADSLFSLLKAKNSALAAEVEAALNDTEVKMRAIPGPFDQAIFSDEGRASILAGVEALEDLAKKLEVASTELGLDLVPLEE